MIFEKGRQPPASDKAAFVDRGRQYGASVLAVPNGIIGTTSEEGDAKRSASDNHVSSSPWIKEGSEVVFRADLDGC